MNSFGKIKRISSEEEFLPFLKQGIPVIVTGVVENWPGFNLFSMDYFASYYADVELPCKLDQGIQRMTLTQLSAHLKNSESQVCYAPQLPFFNYLNRGKEGDLGSQACPAPTWLDNFNEANIWIGRGVTPLHFDGYDNFLAVIEGQKKLMLFPPDAMAAAQTNRQWCLLRAHALAEHYTNYFEVIVEPGEMLYLPPYWLHEVSVPTKNAISINYWYHQQYGQRKSYFLPHIEGVMQNFEASLSMLTESEVTYILSIFEDMLAQFIEGIFPTPQSHLTWSHHGRNNQALHEKQYIRPEFIYKNGEQSTLLKIAKNTLFCIEQMAAELNDGEKQHFNRVMNQAKNKIKCGCIPEPYKKFERNEGVENIYYRSSFL
ncbi:cupin-like domain-containing protein [Pseudoalteromonas sp. S16_S37]|uniref:cupin-like domain-containing protein n=1 Tax=Pseudoalteromonas sp. S16_S37 TaxID=2720228 RepID=UPI0016815445|nr:cupin-like domain-containing protein [Pseudoalteromonas sp. S16_S37]MBD1581831.1 hypothetical protein [Pseudoalteromonas sp. S16_S37]